LAQSEDCTEDDTHSLPSTKRQQWQKTKSDFPSKKKTQFRRTHIYTPEILAGKRRGNCTRERVCMHRVWFNIIDPNFSSSFMAHFQFPSWQNHNSAAQKANKKLYSPLLYSKCEGYMPGTTAALVMRV
jgi:hypothetical protein